MLLLLRDRAPGTGHRGWLGEPWRHETPEGCILPERTVERRKTVAARSARTALQRRWSPPDNWDIASLGLNLLELTISASLRPAGFTSETIATYNATRPLTAPSWLR